MTRRTSQRVARTPKNQVMPGFVLRRCFSVEVNLERLERHMRRVLKTFERAGDLSNVRRRVRIRARTSKVSRPGHHYPGQNEATGTRPGAKDSGN